MAWIRVKENWRSYLMLKCYSKSNWFILRPMKLWELNPKWIVIRSSVCVRRIIIRSMLIIRANSISLMSMSSPNILIWYLIRRASLRGKCRIRLTKTSVLKIISINAKTRVCRKYKKPEMLWTSQPKTWHPRIRSSIIQSQVRHCLRPIMPPLIIMIPALTQI